MKKPKCPEILDKEFEEELSKCLNKYVNKMQNNWFWKEYIEFYPELKKKVLLELAERIIEKKIKELKNEKSY